MNLSESAKRAILAHREEREMTKAGWERVGERGGNLWQVYRGVRRGQRILDVSIALDGMSLWVKIGDPQAKEKLR